MKLSPRVLPGAARLARGVGEFVARLRACVWAVVVLRITAVAAGLALLAVIGGSALAGGGGPFSASSPPVASVAAPGELPPSRALPDAPDPLTWADAQAHAVVPPSPTSDVPVEQGPSPHGRATPDDPVVLNEAGADELRRLPGIGAKRAGSILQLRAKMGRFRQVEDLLKVKGIGRAMLKRLRPLVRLDGGGPAPSPPAR
jgi:competence protein ComEA